MPKEGLWLAIEGKPGFELLEKRELAMLRLLAEGTSLHDMRACASIDEWRKEAGFVRGFYGNAERGTIHATWPADIIGKG